MGLFRKSVEEPLRPAQYTAFADGSMALEGEPRPEQFELREYGFLRGMAWFCLTASLLFEGALVVLAYTGEESGAWLFLLGGLLFLGSLWFMSDAYVRRIRVDGSMIHYTTSLGRRRVFSVEEIGYITLSYEIGNKMYDKEGRCLLRWESNMRNAPYFIWFLTDHHISIRR